MAEQSRTRRFSPLRVLIAANAAAWVIAPAIGQCPLQQLPGPALSGTDDMILAVCEWDPDGAGPRTPVVVAGGKFGVAGGMIVNRIAAYDPATASWSGFGTGMNGDVLALAVLPSGDLVAAGTFTDAGGNPVNQIARWNGASWAPLGTGTTGPVRALAVLANGDLVAGGTFVIAGGAFASNIARWNGVAWGPFGIAANNGVNDTVHALATLPNGDVFAGGDFTIAGGSPANRIARWNGASWSALGAGTPDKVKSLVARPNGNVVAGLFMTSALGPFFPPTPVVTEWNGTGWTTLLTAPTLVPQIAASIVNLPSGDIAIGGPGVRSWNGTTWSILGAVTNVKALAVLANGSLVAGGSFLTTGTVDAQNLAFLSGTTWSATNPPPGPTGVLPPMLPLPGGDLLSAAHFGDTSTSIGRWSGNTFSPFGAAFQYGTVANLALHPSGDVFVVGSFVVVGTTAASRVARWNGSAWLPLGAGVAGGYGIAFAVTIMPNGDVVVGGEFTAPANGVARWNGSSWSPLGAGLTGIRTLLALPNGDVLAGCSAPAPSGVMRFDGTSWSPLGALPPDVLDLELLPNGDVVAGGTFTGTPLNLVARWDGTTWLPLGSGVGSTTGVDVVRDIKALPDGGVIACGSFSTAGGVAVPNAARWNGSAWSPVVNTVTSGNIHAVGIPQTGGIVLGGRFSMVDGQVSARLAQLAPTCPAIALPSGTGCTGSGGPNVLAAQSLPWCGSTYRAIATGLPASSLALGAYGVATIAIALPAILPQGAAGCSLLVTPDALELLVPAGGTAQTQLAIPSTVSLAGIVLHQQMIALDLGPTGSIVSVTSSNRLSLTIGAF